MKKTLFTTLSIISFSMTYAQMINMNVNDQANQAYLKVNSQGSGKALAYEEISGSPYINKNFSPAKVDNNITVPIRYNSFRDDVEFQKDNSILVLPKDANYSRIDIITPKQTLVLLDTNDDLNGYFFEISGGKNALYKKVKTKFIDAVPAANSFATEKPATFRTLDPVYYIKTESGFIKNPKNIKEVTEQLPNQKDAIEAFSKTNKLKLSKEDDLIKLVQFLNK
ncbi:hypothetical protein [Chryseobacterium sp.]|uniref:hypothetical protein n=1 Tax=Chryseobacterium sp. TaxID=1871047 RepID=UPI0028A0CF38|nr:hypothetical protein [Chryseobacterium sp.]